MVIIKNNPTSDEGKYMLLVDNAEFALETAIAKLDVIIRLMDAGPEKEATMARYNGLDRELTYMKDKDSAWIHGDGEVRAPTAKEVSQTQSIAEELEKVTASSSNLNKLLKLAASVVKVSNGIFGSPPAPANK
ncbi:MAG: hypothetical protein ACJ8GW_17100 [Massilia sp.]